MADDTSLYRLAGCRKTRFFNSLLGRVGRLCGDLNSCLVQGNFLAIAFLVRAILDHIPPVFGCRNFTEVANTFEKKRGRVGGGAILGEMNVINAKSPSLGASSVDNTTVLPGAIPAHSVQHSVKNVRVSLGCSTPGLSLLSYMFTLPLADGAESSIKP